MDSALRDQLELQDLAFAYATALDERDVSGFAALFTEDAHLGVYAPEATDPLLGYDGRDEIGQAVGLLDPYGPTMHVMSNHRVAIDGDSATGTVYCVANHSTVRDRTPHNLVMTIRYADRYRRTDSGWRFTHRKIIRMWNELRPLMDEQMAF